jgi:hypothetical protein
MQGFPISLDTATVRWIITHLHVHLFDRSCLLARRG